MSAGFGRHQIGWIFDYTPNLVASLRYYYNLKKRRITGRNIKYYSGNYISFLSKVYLERWIHTFEKNKYFFGPGWGIQRDLGRRFQMSAEVGLGMGGPINDLIFTPHLGFTLGYRIN